MILHWISLVALSIAVGVGVLFLVTALSWAWHLGQRAAYGLLERNSAEVIDAVGKLYGQALRSAMAGGTGSVRGADFPDPQGGVADRAYGSRGTVSVPLRPRKPMYRQD